MRLRKNEKPAAKSDDKKGTDLAIACHWLQISCFLTCFIGTHYQPTKCHILLRSVYTHAHKHNKRLSTVLQVKLVILKKKGDYSEAAFVFASLVHTSRCLCSSFRMALTIVPNFLFLTSFAIELRTS